ncbi:MAG TPA: FtsQ-type POTRA domain-containing protein [Acidimicrobiia bacterium]|jgi:cell division protein FtsQ|nr:FtsQ-type POTRA domain-containing protein [Acidimicrobiia bacterium]
MSIDPRLVERRRTVAEDNAKRNVTRLLKFLAFVLVAGSLVWLLFSPWLSVDLVNTKGVEASSTNSILVDVGVMAGTPMIMVNPGAVERALLADPWVAEAVVMREWPDTVNVEVVERVPVAWARTAGGWTRRSMDGVALPSADEPGPEMGWVDLPEVSDELAPETPELLGAIAFVAALPDELQEGTVVTRVDDELWATVSGHQVRLGRPVDMEDKALSLTALLEQGVLAGSTVVLIAPTNPAVQTPGSTDDSPGHDQ